MKLDILVNFAAAIWVAALTFLFAPVYVHYLGVEAYGLIGILAALQASLGLLDLGLSQVITRETARYVGGAISTQAVRNLFRTVEIIGMGLAVLVTAVVALPANWIATYWLNSSDLPPDNIVVAIRFMAVLVALRLLEGIFKGAVIGLHQQLWLNVITVCAATARTVGALAVFVSIAASLEAFLVWQIIVAIANVASLVALIYVTLPEKHLRGTFSFVELRGVARFATGIAMSSILSVVLVQTDKLLLTKLLPLKDFGEYTLAATLAAAPQVFAGPIVQAIQPRLVSALANTNISALTRAFHGGAQLVTVMVGAAGIVIILFSREALALWVREPELSMRLAPLVSVLALGSLLNGLMWMPTSLQLAYGWVGLTLRAMAVSVVILVPLLLVVTPRFGVMGAAAVWVLLNFGSFTITAHVMFRRILTPEKARWYLTDIAAPLLAAAVAASLVKILAPPDGPTWSRFVILAIAGASAMGAAAVSAPDVRAGLVHWMRSFKARGSSAIGESRKGLSREE